MADETNQSTNQVGGNNNETPKEVNKETIQALGQLAQKVTKNDVSDVKALNDMLTQLMKDPLVQSHVDDNLKGAIANVQNAAKAAETNAPATEASAEETAAPSSAEPETKPAEETTTPAPAAETTTPSPAAEPTAETANETGSNSNTGEAANSKSCNWNKGLKNGNGLKDGEDDPYRLDHFKKALDGIYNNPNLDADIKGKVNALKVALNQYTESDPRAERIKRIKQIYGN